MSLYSKIAAIILITMFGSSCVEKGCLDPRASNYAEEADHHNGDDCEYDNCLNEEKDCQNGGDCNENGECDCTERYHGKFCEKEKTPKKIKIERIVFVNNEFDMEMFLIIENKERGDDLRTHNEYASKKDTVYFYKGWREWSVKNPEEEHRIKVVEALVNGDHRVKATIDRPIYKKGLGFPDTLISEGTNKDFQVKIEAEYQF